MATDPHDIHLTETPGVADPRSDQMITTRTRRRQEQLDQLTDPAPSPRGGTRGGEVDDRNDASYREAWGLEHTLPAVRDDEGIE